MKQANSQQEIAITEYGLKCITGNMDFALFGAVATDMNCSKDDSLFESLSQSDTGADPIISCPILALDNITEVEERMFECLRETLNNTIERLQERQISNKQQSSVTNEKTLIFIIIPGNSTERSTVIDKKQWLSKLCESNPDFIKCKYHFEYAETSVAKHLETANAQLLKGQFDRILFCGVDSLIDEATCEQLGEQRRLLTTKNADGIILGEAAACVVLERYNVLNNIQQSNKQEKPRAIIKAISRQNEQFAGKPHLHQLVAQRNTISTCAQQANLQLDDIETIIHTTGGERHTQMEWYQTTQALWPNKLPEAQRVAYQLGEIDLPVLKQRKMPEELNLGMTVGDVGAASIPMGLIIACARFEFNYPEVSNCVVCEANDFPFRSAILLLNPQINLSQQQSQTSNSNKNTLNKTQKLNRSTHHG